MHLCIFKNIIKRSYLFSFFFFSKFIYVYLILLSRYCLLHYYCQIFRHNFDTKKMFNQLHQQFLMKYKYNLLISFLLHILYTRRHS